MKLLFLGLALGFLPASGQQWDSSSGAPILLYAQFEGAPSQPLLDALHGELESIMTPLGLEFAWRDLAGVRGNEAARELAVVNFKGRCDIGGLAASLTHSTALGWTHVSDGVILPFSDVDCDRIRAFVQKGLLLLPRKDREATFGRAMGRVLAHELYHVFANTARHGSCGVGKASYSVEDLLSLHFRFEERESRALRSVQAPPRQKVGEDVRLAAVR